MAAAGWQLTAHLLSGRSTSVSLRPESAVAELRSAVAAGLGLEAEDLQLFHDGSDVLASGPLGQSLESAGLSDGARLDVAVRSWARPMQTPARFNMCLTAVAKACSSSFVQRFNLSIDTPASRAAVAEWRKNDHDKFVYDTQLGTRTGYTQHWMTGSEECTRPLGFSNVPLSELFDAWRDRVSPVFDVAERFWKVPGDVPHKDDAEDPRLRFGSLRRRPSAKSQVRPTSLFVAPSEDCTELLVNAEMPFFTLLRVLVDVDGIPVRAAIFTDCPNHDNVTEYRVEMTEATADDHL